MGNRLKIELGDICERYGVSLDALTGIEVAALADDCEQIDGIMHAAANILADCPAYFVRGLPFYELTPCAAEWLERTAGWWPCQSPMRFWATAYASAHAHNFTAFARLHTRKAATLAILRMSVRFIFRHAEIEDAVHWAVYRKHDEGWTASNTATTALWQNEWQSFVDRMEAQDGTGRGEWLWGASGERAAQAYQDLHKFDFLRFMPKRRAAMIEAMEAAMANLARDKKRIGDRLSADPHRGGAKVVLEIKKEGGRNGR